MKTKLTTLKSLNKEMSPKNSPVKLSVGKNYKNIGINS